MNTNLLEQYKTAGHEALGPPTQAMVREILAPTDFSNESRVGTNYAMNLAERLGATAVLLHVVEPLPPIGGTEAFPLLPTLMKQAEQALQRMAANLNGSTGIKASVVVRDGIPHKEICRAAKDLHADLIALTTHGYTGIKHVWLGSTAERVVRHARCPVLVVRDKKTSPVT